MGEARRPAIGTTSGGAPDQSARRVPVAPGRTIRAVHTVHSGGSQNPGEGCLTQGRGRLVSVDLRGVRSGLGEHAYVYLPPQYFSAAVRHLPEPPIGLFATIARGEGGAEGYVDTMRLQRAVAAAHGPLQLRTVVVAVGGHSFASWSTVMPQAFSWLSSRLGTAA